MLDDLSRAYVLWLGKSAQGSGALVYRYEPTGVRDQTFAVKLQDDLDTVGLWGAEVAGIAASRRRTSLPGGE